MANASDFLVSSNPYLVDECRGVLHVYRDGSIVRSSKPSFDVPIADDGSVLWKDVVFYPSYNLQLRLYKPAYFSSSSSSKLPIFYSIHGGLAAELRAVVISPDYLLAPENRLPAAIDDGFMAVEWLQAQAVSDKPDTWLSEVADFSRVFISGDLAGGNIAHNLAVRLGPGSPELTPVRVRGYVLLAPFFGGTVRTVSEADGPKDTFLNLELIDRFWKLSVLTGDKTDHPLVNTFGPYSKTLKDMDLGPILSVIGGNDLLKDRAMDYATRLKDWGEYTEYVEFERKQHGFFTIDPNPEASNKLTLIIKQFVYQHSDLA